MNDVSGRQSRIGAVLRAQLVDRAFKTEIDVVLLNRGGECEMYDRLGHRGIDELDGAAVENETISVEDDVAAAEIGAPQNDRVCNRSAYLKICRPVDTERAADQVHLIRRVDSEIKRDVLGESLRGRSFYTAAELADKVAEIEGGRERKVGEVDVAAKDAACGDPVRRIFAFTDSRIPCG